MVSGPLHRCLGLGGALPGIRQWQEDRSCSWHKLPVEFDNPQEVLELLDVGWVLVGSHGGHPVWKGG